MLVKSAKIQPSIDSSGKPKSVPRNVVEKMKADTDQDLVAVEVDFKRIYKKLSSQVKNFSAAL